MKTPLLTFAITISMTVSYGQNYYATTLGWTDGQTTIKNIRMTSTASEDFKTLSSSEPRIKKGRTLISDYILSQVEYPDLARVYGVEGMAIVKFEIDRFGQLKSYEFLKSAHPLLDASITKTIKALPKMDPAFEDGKPIDSSVVLPIRFYLR